MELRNLQVRLSVSTSPPCPSRRRLVGESLEPRRLLAQTVWPVEEGGNGHAYEAIADRATWEEARWEAIAAGGRLVTIADADEEAFVRSLLAEGDFIELDGAGPWIGAIQADDAEAPGDAWTWITGETLEGPNWIAGQPDDAAGEETVAALRASVEEEPSGWSDELSARRLAFVIEYDEIPDPLAATVDEFEFNDSLTQATDLGELGVASISANLHAAVDRDFYQLTVGSVGRLTVDATYEPTSGSMGLQLLDATGELLATADGLSGAASVSISAAPGQVVYVLASSPLGDLLDYQLELQTTPGDRWEPNDESASATDLGSVVHQIESDLSISPGDLDYFRFTAAADGVLSVRIAADQSFDPLHLRLLDSEGELIAEGAGEGGVQQTPDRVVTAGEEFLVEVSAGEGEFNPFYDLRIDVGDEFEPNDSLDAAYDLGVGASFDLSNLTFHHDDDRDYFRFESDAVGQARVSFAAANPAARVLAEVFDDAGQLLASRQLFAAQPSLDFAASQGDVRIVAVRPLIGLPDWDYSLSIDVATGDALEPNDAAESAIDLGDDFLGAKRDQLSLHSSEDQDWFRLAPAVDGRLVVDAVVQRGDVPVRVRVYNSNGDLAAESPANPEDSSVATASVLAGEEYHVVVDTELGEVVQEYSLAARVDDPFEPNDADDSAADLGVLGSASFVDLTLPTESDRDQFLFTASGHGSAHVLVQYTPDGGFFQIEVYDGTGAFVAYGEGESGSGDASFQVEGGNDYRIIVYAIDSPASVYSLDITVDAPPPLEGDVNLDGQVDLSDFVLLKTNFGGVGRRTDGDLNDDGKISLEDFVLLKTNFGATASIAASPDAAIAAIGGAAHQDDDELDD